MFKNIYRPLLTKHLYIGAYYLNIPFEQGKEEDNMKQHKITRQENTVPEHHAMKIFNYLINDEYKLAHGYIDAIYPGKGVSDFLEQMIKQEGLSFRICLAIAQYYAPDLKEARQ